MRNKINKVLVIDFEALCWKESQAYLKSEIIEIGYCLIDHIAPAILASGSILVEPDVLDVSEFATSIHGWTASDLKGELKLNDAFAFLAEQIGSLKQLPWASYGDYDREQLSRECLRKGIEFPLSRTHTNVKFLNSLLNGKSDLVSLDIALKQRSMEFFGQQHKGSDDAKNTALLLLNIIGRPIKAVKQSIVSMKIGDRVVLDLSSKDTSIPLATQLDLALGLMDKNNIAITKCLRSALGPDIYQNLEVYYEQ